jgi:hypothetical protein
MIANLQLTIFNFQLFLCAPLRHCTAIRQFHSFSRGFLTTDCTDNTDELTAMDFSYPCHPRHPWSIRLFLVAPLRLRVFALKPTSPS